MKASEIVTQLATLLPVLSDKFTDEISVTSMTRSGTTVTANTATAHELKINNAVSIVGSITPIAITSLTRSGTTGTMVTGSRHDLTFGTEMALAGVSIDLEGSIESEFNGSFAVLSVPDRNTATFTMPNSGATTATGSPIVTNAESALNQYNGLKQITAIPTTTQFQFEISSSTLFTPASGAILARTKPRISSAVTLERLIASYTKQSQDDLWAFVVLDDVSASKSRSIESDAVDNIQRGNNYRQQIIQPFAVYVFIPASQETSGRSARDQAEDLFRPICRSLLFSKFDSGLSLANQGAVQFVSHGQAGYDTAVYIHAYNFQQTVDINFDDTVGYDLDVAFRDINTDMTIDFGTESFTADINLDG